MALSPIYRLDDDTWRTILLCVFQGEVEVKDGIRIPIRLSHVSREWRRIAVNTAELWTVRISDMPLYHSYILGHPPWSITPIVIHERSWESEMMNVFSARSKGAPLQRALFLAEDDARLRYPWKEFGPTKALIAHLVTPQDAVRLLQAIPDSSNRLESLTLSTVTGVLGMAGGPSEWDEVRELLYTKVTGVQVLDLSGSAAREIFENRSPSEVLLRACRRLSLSTEGLSVASLLNVVHCSTVVESLTIHLIQFDGFQGPTFLPLAGDRVLKAHLEELNLQIPWDLTDVVLERINAPSLRKLSLKSSGPSPENVYATERFLQASAPPLTHLCFVKLKPGPCSSILSSVPTLTSLSVEPGGDTTVFEVLTPLEGMALCPALETLSYLHWGPSTQALSSLLTMVRARLAAHEANPTDFKRLRTLGFMPYRVPESDRPIVEELASLLGDGLSLNGWRLDLKTKTWHWTDDTEEYSRPRSRFRQLSLPF